jgi:hypothetical protein
MPKFRITNLLVITAFLAVISVAHAEDVVLVLQQGRKGYSGSQDVSISADGRLANDNLGGRHSIDIWQFDGVALIRFELTAVPRNAVVKDASLELYCFSVGFSPEEQARAWPVGIYECIHGWKEGTGNPDAKHAKDGATLKTYDGMHPWPAGKVTAIAGESLGRVTHESAQERWYKWPLKAAVFQEWVAGSRPNNGLMVWGKAPGKAVSFTSKDSTAADRRPILRLTLSLPDSDVGKLGELAASDIAWPQFIAECGRKAQESNEARTEQAFEETYVGRTVRWTGTVDSTKRKPIGSGYFVNVLMDPTESAFGTFDLMLDAPERLKDEVLSLNKGQRVTFMARFSRQGGALLGHQLDLLTIGPQKPPEQPQRGPTQAPPRRKRRR